MRDEARQLTDLIEHNYHVDEATLDPVHLRP
jgi:hypothetical protein